LQQAAERPQRHFVLVVQGSEFRVDLNQDRTNLIDQCVQCREQILQLIGFRLIRSHRHAWQVLKRSPQLLQHVQSRRRSCHRLLHLRVDMLPVVVDFNSRRHGQSPAKNKKRGLEHSP